MSATNRGAPRHARDFYETPAEAIDPLLVFLPTPAEQGRKPRELVHILDAGCGSGALGRAMRRSPHYTRSKLFVEGIDLEPQGSLEDFDRVTAGNFLTHPHGFDLCIMNPPFKLAQEFITHALALRPEHGCVAALLRLGFLASRKRHGWWLANAPDRLFVLPKRPSFTGDGKTDATDYMWAVWDPHSLSVDWPRLEWLS